MRDMMPRIRLIILTLAVAITATCAHAAELEIPPPAKPKDLSVFANQPNCMRWTDECVNCTRGTDGKGPTCSNPGFACQPKPIRCMGDAPRSEPQTK